MKVMHILQSSFFSGAENVVCQIISMFGNDENFEIIYCSQDGAIRAALLERGIKFISLKDFSKKSVKKAIDNVNPDIVHAHDMRASFVAASVCGKIPLISHIHNNAFDSRGFSFKSIAYLYAGFKAKHIFWVSQSSFDGYLFHNLLKKKSEVLYNIIDIDALYKRAEQDQNSYDYDVIYLGRLTTSKNPMRLLEVCKLLVEKKNDIQIAIVGTGEMEAEVKTKAQKMDLLSNISFLGFQFNPTKILKDSKIMLMTSLWEGTPMCALEAAALGTPIVSTPVDGLKDLIVNDETGYLSDNNDELASKIIEYITDKNKIETLSNNQIYKAKQWNNKKNYYKKIKKSYLG